MTTTKTPPENQQSDIYQSDEHRPDWEHEQSSSSNQYKSYEHRVHQANDKAIHNQFSHPRQYEASYSTNLIIAFGAMKFLSLFLLGLGISCIISASLQSFQIVAVLIKFASVSIVPLTVGTLSIVVIAIFFESWK